MARGLKFVRWDRSQFTDQVRSVCEVDERGCWLWSYGDYDREWYPEIMINRRRQSVARWLLEFRLDRRVNTARHSCDRPRCCNPEHLTEGTQADNVRDALERGRRPRRRSDEERRAATHVNRPYQLARGEAHGLHKLTTEQVVAIRAAASAGASNYAQGKTYGVAKSTISSIVRRKTWQHV